MVAGYAVGGGHILHLVCDLTIAAENARFGQTGPRVGSFDGGFGASLLANNVGVKRAKEIWFLCRLYDAAEALQMGLVNTVVPVAELERETVAWCREMNALSPALAAPPEVELQRHGGRADRDPAALARRDAPLLHVRGGPGGPQLVPAGPLPRLLEVPAALSPCGSGSWRRGPRTLPAAISPVLVGTAAAYWAVRGRPLGRLRRRADRVDLDPDRHQPRQRLLGRQARRGHGRPARPGARDLVGPGRPAAGPPRDLDRVRRGARGRHLPGDGRRPGRSSSSGSSRSPPASSTRAAPGPTATPASASSSSSCSSGWSRSTAPTTSSSRSSTCCRSCSRFRSGCSRPRSWSSTTSATWTRTPARASGRWRCASGGSAPACLYVALVGRSLRAPRLAP